MNYFYQQDQELNKIRSAFVNNISIDIKLTKAQISKIIQSCEFLHIMSSNLDKKVITDLPSSLARDNLREL